MGSGTSKEFLLKAVVIVLVLLAANAWLSYRIFWGGASSGLPRLSLNPFKATTLIIGGLSNKSPGWTEEKNILILGRAGAGNSAPDLTDTIIILHIDPLANKIKMLSIPRDLLISPASPKPSQGGPQMAEGAVFKINALWLYSQNFRGSELDTIKTEMEKITGIYASNVLVFDLATVAKVIEDMDGITVNVTEAIYDPQFPTPSGGYEIFSLPSGRRYLDAATALKFVRTRASAGGDFDRIDRQQELLRALKGKITSLSPIWNFPTLWSIFITVKKSKVYPIPLLTRLSVL